jgi:hypothetical protein
MIAMSGSPTPVSCSVVGWAASRNLTLLRALAQPVASEKADGLEEFAVLDDVDPAARRQGDLVDRRRGGGVEGEGPGVARRELGRPFRRERQLGLGERDQLESRARIGRQRRAGRERPGGGAASAPARGRSAT